MAEKIIRIEDRDGVQHELIPSAHTHTPSECGAAASDHTHSGYAASDHTHDGRYYTESEVNELLDDKADETHTHAADDIVVRSALSQTGTPLPDVLSNKADSVHDHDDKYAAIGHTHDYSGTYAAIDHTHSANYHTLAGWNMYSVSVYGVKTHVVTYDGNYLSSGVNASSYIKVPSGKTKVVVNDGTVQKGGVVIFRSIMSESETKAYIIIDAIVNP